MSEPRNAIKLEHGDTLTDRSAEVARIWVTDGAGSSVWIDAAVLQDPTVFGYLMGDTIRHAARAYARTWDLDEDEALQRIVDGTFSELRDQIGDLDTIEEGKLN